MNINPGIFKSYDVRGTYPQDFNEEIAYLITQAYIKLHHPQKVVLGRDVRESGESLFNSSLKAFLDSGVDVIDVGVVSTDMFYYAVGSLFVDGGITISASHNPREYNGMNFCKKGAEPISSESGLYDIRDLVIVDQSPIISEKKGNTKKQDITDNFIKMVASYVDLSVLKPIKIVANGNFGIDVMLFKKSVTDYKLPIDIVPLNEKPDGTFPKGPPNPLLPENRKEFLDLILKEKANLGVSWDADGDRCFFADEKGKFVEGYFTTAVLAQEMLKKCPNSKVIIDPRLVWATTEAIKNAGGIPIVSKPGMTVIAVRMKKEDAVFGGEMSSHFYFRDNFYRDNGLIPLFLILEMMAKYNKPLSELVAPFTSKYFTPGEINFETNRKDKIIAFFEEKFKDGKVEHIDGFSVEYPEWRLNLRKSNTEPLLRLNLEAKSKGLMEQKKEELVSLIRSLDTMIDKNKSKKESLTDSPYARRIEKPWGYELHFVPDGKPYMGKIIHIRKGKRLSLQVHDKKLESFLLLKGRAKVVWDDSKKRLIETELKKGKGYSCEAGQRHRLVAKTDCDIVEVSTPEIGTTYRLEDDYKRGDETEEIRKKERGEI